MDTEQEEKQHSSVMDVSWDDGLGDEVHYDHKYWPDL